MITVLSLWERINQYAAKFQSGQMVVASFNSALDEVQKEIYNDLSPYYQGNEKVRGLLAPWVKTLSAAFSIGVYTVSDPLFDRIVALGATDNSGLIAYDIAPITEGEIVSYSLIPQRKPDVAKKRVYYTMATPLIVNIYPKVNLTFTMFYLGYPTLAKIAFTYAQVSDEYVMAYDAAGSTDLAWSQDAFNIILYKMLEKYGIDTRDQWTAEYARMGVSKPVLNQGGNS